MSWPWIVLLAAVGALSLYTIVQAVTRRHGVENALAWLFAIIALPGIGALAYLMLAIPSVRRATKQKRKTRRRVREAMAASGDKHHPSPGKVSDEVDALFELSHRLTGLPPTTGNRVELLSHDQRVFRRIEAAIKSAQRLVWTEYYIIRNDETGLRFLDLLVDKAAEGVEVRLLYDAVGSLGLDRQRLAALRAAGGFTSDFLPLNPLRKRWAIQLRNHRKIVIVDGQVGYTGGMNIGDEYSGRARRRGRMHFRDAQLELCGPAVGDLMLTFADDWSFATGEKLAAPEIQRDAESPGEATIGMVPSGPDQELNASSMVFFSAIASAKRRLYISSPYFIPDGPTVRALQAAALSGVDVRIMVPAKSDVPLVNRAARSYFPLLVRDGIRIFEYQPSVLHAKTMIVDDQLGIIGSANIDFRSFRLNFELSALVADGAFVQSLSRRYAKDLSDSIELTGAMLERDGALARFRDGVVRLLSPLL